MSFPLLVRAAFVIGVAILILACISLINGKIHERRNRADEVARQFAAETSNAQLVSGPFLALTCEWRGKGPDKKVDENCTTQVFTPTGLKVDADVPVETRHRGIYPIRLFHASIGMSGTFEWPAATAPGPGDSTRVWKHAYLVIDMSDPRGINSLSVAGNAPVDSRYAIREDLGPFNAHKPGEIVAFDVKMKLSGTGSLLFLPVGESNEIRIKSPWAHPSFQGGWSPDERNIGPEGFEATWHIKRFAEARDTVGFAIFDPLNVYALSYRATEYAFLFLLFTFSALALTEVLAGVRLHAIQYLLVGSALAVFFLLLIALSEHVNFSYAYLAASSACVLLLTIYLRHPLGTWLRATAFFTMFVVLYGVLFVLLRSEDHALLMGSLLVFGVLAVTMLATRKLDWNEVSKRMLGNPAASTVA